MQVKLVTNTSKVQIAHLNLHLTNNVTIKFIRVFRNDIENWYHYDMKFYIALRYRYSIIMMLEKDII